jgi:Zn-dependent peptidase ImmA (M78 family)
MKLLSLVFSFFILAPAWSLTERTIHVESPQRGGSWMNFTSSAELNLKKLFELLGRSPTGKKLLEQAAYKASLSGQTLLDVIQVGEGSLTDTTLVRKFSPQNPEHVVYESRSVVYINRHLSWDDALLDLAHELTHFNFRENFNPYASDFNPQGFIKSTIEGRGGEVQAFMTECLVLKELFSRNVQSRSHCQTIEVEGQLSRHRAVELFYHLGPYYDAFKQQLSKRKIDSAFSQIKAAKINFISSAYGVPYPVAALMEYDLVLNKVCENDKKRLAYMQQGPQRGPAAVPPEQDKLVSHHSARCHLK